ncbi:hypothetical protein QBC40DRAFT_249766 [Triangularia verruculosa]|uniref:Thaumatin-like protein n=1 Tax=Triangularia verruculosa TaxID=2587418 RepID=A0AAN6XPZ0_9PEZI|nr:hypothetical protein QBC40DRAFT_249766 [Triangularia verruculosa]
MSMIDIQTRFSADPAHALSAPAVTRVAVTDIPWGTALGGALDPHPKIDPDSPVTGLTAPPNWKIRVTNKAGVSLTTLHVKNAPKSTGLPDLPDPIGGIPPPGNMAPESVFEYAVPTGWSGRIAFAEAGKLIVGDESLIEASFEVQVDEKNVPIVNYALGDIDVSYVDGYTFPIMCSCAADNRFLSGCDSPKLWGQSIACPDKNPHGACRNPHRDKDQGQVTYAHEWFKGCQGRAYTFPKDDKANSNGQCQSGTVNCQILPK